MQQFLDFALLVSGICEATHGMDGKVQVGEVTEFGGIGGRNSNAYLHSLNPEH
jgi:hypothetical protein